MKAKTGSEKPKPKLIKTTVRFTEDVISVIDELAKSFSVTRSDVIRIAVDSRLKSYLSNVVFVEHEDAIKHQQLLTKIYDELESIRMELHRIGVNYNQEIKLKNARQKIENDRREKRKTSYDLLKEKERIEKEILSDTKSLSKDEINKLMIHFEKVSKVISNGLKVS